MAQPDWTRGDLSHRMQVLMVDPLNLSTIRGELSNVIPGGKCDYAYYSDTRTGAAIKTFGDDGWDGTAALRIVHVVSDYTGDLWQETLGTYYVTKRSWSDGSGEQRTTDYTLSGTLHGLETNVTPRPYAVAKGAKALDVIRNIMKTTSRPYYIEGGARNYTFSRATVYDAGKSYLSILFDVCNRARDRLSVVRDGRAVITPYTAPSQCAPNFSVADDEPRSLLVPPFETGDAGLDVPERAIVSAKEGSRTITGVAVAPAGQRRRHSRRGYGIDDFRSLTNMSPFTQKQADRLAQQYLAGDTEARTASHELRYRPLREGDIEQLTIGGDTRRWHIQNASLDLASWTWSLDLRGGWK